MTDRTFLWVALLFYAISSALTWRRLRAGGASESLHRVNHVAMLCGFAAQTMFMLLRGEQIHRCPLTNIFEVQIFVAWAAVLFYLLIGPAYRISFLGAFTAPVVFVIGLVALLAPVDVARVEALKHSSWVEFHAALGAISYGAFALAFVVGVMYLLQEHQLKSRRLMPAFMEMPALMQLDVINVRLMILGFALLTVSMIGGVISHRILGHVPVPKVIWAWVVWIVYGAALLARPVLGWRGRRTAWLAIISFVLLLASFWVITLLREFYQAS
jgi:HemX protein